MSDTTTWMMREGEVLAVAHVADSYASRMRGLVGRGSFEGALILPRTRSVHTIGMRFELDVAFLSKELQVIDVVRVPPWRLTRPRLRSRFVLEAEAGAFERWKLRTGDQLELRTVRSSGN